MASLEASWPLRATPPGALSKPHYLLRDARIGPSYPGLRLDRGGVLATYPGPRRAVREVRLSDIPLSIWGPVVRRVYVAPGFSPARENANEIHDDRQGRQGLRSRQAAGRKNPRRHGDVQRRDGQGRRHAGWGRTSGLVERGARSILRRQADR